MSGGTFSMALACGAALLALWVNARRPNLAPQRLSWLLVHAGLALALMQLIPSSGNSVPFAFVVVFAVALPVFVYAFLVSIWVIRLGQDATAAYR